MEAWRRMFFVRDCLRGAKLPLVLAFMVIEFGLGVVLFFLFELTPRPLTVAIVEIILWAVAASIINNLRSDPYYSFELVPTRTVLVLVFILLTLMWVENSPNAAGNDVITQLGTEVASGLASIAAPLVILVGVLYTWLVTAAGSALALMFAGQKFNVSGWAQEVQRDVKSVYDTAAARQGQASKPSPTPPAHPAVPLAGPPAEGSRPQAAASGQPVPVPQPDPTPAQQSVSQPAAEPIPAAAPEYDEGQLAMRNMWQRATASTYIHCRRCGERLAIWAAPDSCPRCGDLLGIPDPQVQCINDAMCGTKVGQNDNYCFRCGTKQPVVPAGESTGRE